MTRIFPPIALALPFFLEFKAIGLTDTPFGLIVAYVPIVFPLLIWILCRATGSRRWDVAVTLSPTQLHRLGLSGAGRHTTTRH